MKILVVLSIASFSFTRADRDDSGGSWTFQRGLNFNNGVVLARPYELFHFADRYTPVRVTPQFAEKKDTTLSFSEEKQKLRIHGVNTASLKLSLYVVEASTEFEKARTRTKSSEKVKTYITSRMVYGKYDVFTDSRKLIIKSDFAEALKSAATGRGQALDKCARLVDVLNEYGWYVPLNYKLGGALYSTKETEVSSMSEAYRESSRFEASLGIKLTRFGGEAGVKRISETESSTDRTEKNESTHFARIGGTTSEPDAFANSLEDPKNWRIVAYESFLPTLMLLKGYDDSTLNKCLRLLGEYATYKHIKRRQRNINIRDYEYDIVSRLGISY